MGQQGRANQRSQPTTALQRRFVRRYALRMVLLNGALWSAGNGLTSGAVIYYLAFEMGASGADIGWILAAPAMAGLLRIFSPQLIRVFGSPRSTCLLAWLAAYVFAFGLPLLALPFIRPAAAATGVTLLVVVLATHQLLEYVGVVGFWAWMAEIVPRQIRGRYFGRRNRWQLAALIPALLGSGWFIDTWKENIASAGGPDVGWAYALMTAVGATLLLASLVPMLRIHYAREGSLATTALPAREETHNTDDSPADEQSRWTAPFRDPRFRRLLSYGCFVSFANGVTQSAQSFANRSYGIALGTLAAMRIGMYLGQFALSGPLGRFSDRFGNRPVLIGCQMVVALGPMFYLLASPQQPWWIWGAWLSWSAFAGLNICLPNLMLKLASAQAKAAYIAVYFAVSGVIYALSTIAGGYLLDALQTLPAKFNLGSFFTAERLLFLTGWILRTLSVLLLVCLIEPGAARWLKLLVRRRPPALDSRASDPKRDLHSP